MRARGFGGPENSLVSLAGAVALGAQEIEFDIWVTRDGEIVHEKCLPLGLVMDERIATGYYFAQAFRKMKEYFKNPALLEEPPERILVDPEL